MAAFRGASESAAPWLSGRARRMEDFTRRLPDGWPLGEVEFTQGLVWGTSDVLASRQRLTPWACKALLAADPTLPIVVTPPSELIRARWDTETSDWGAFARETIPRRGTIGLYAGLLRDDEPAFWARTASREKRYTAPLIWRGRALVVDATQWGNLVRFIDVTADEGMANVSLGIGRCDCGISDPAAVLVATATRKIDEGERLLRYEPDASRRGEASSARESGTPKAGFEVNPETGVPFFAGKDGAGPSERKRAKVSQKALYTPIPFMDIKARDPHGLRDDMCAHLPNPRVKIWRIDDPAHACFGAHGLRAAQAIKAGSLVGRYTGFITSPGSLQTSDLRGTYTVSHSGGGLVIDAFVHGNEIRFINDWHGIVPETKGSNSEISHGWCKCRKGDGCLQVIVKASADIEPGDEVLTDYGPEYWKNLFGGAEFWHGFADGLGVDSDEGET